LKLEQEIKIKNKEIAMSHRAEINGSRKNAFLFFNLDFNFDL
jgi:hypothetical protein